MLMAISFSCRAQERAAVLSEKFVHVSFPLYVHEIEQKLACHFYYDQADLDTLTVSLTLVDADLGAALSQTFAASTVSFAIDADRQVFLSRGKKIVTTFPEGFFQNEPPRPASRYTGEAVYDPLAKRSNGPSKRMSENRLFTIGGEVSNGRGHATLAGYLLDGASGEPVAGAAVFIDDPRIGGQTDRFGYYSLTLPEGRHELKVRAVGMRDTRRQIQLNGDGKLNIDLLGQVMALKEVVVSSEKTANVNRTQMGIDRLDIKNIKQVPTVFGEADILQVVLTLPGVKSVGEGTVGFNVRGGAADQNLILFNGMTIYNPSHFFGFFSAFNPDVIKDVELYKSSIPAKYGGRLSSVLELTGKEGNKKKITGTAGIGLLTSRISVEGPLIKDKSSFVFGARTTYSNWLLDLLPKNAGYGNSRASFYDMNLLINHQIDEKNSLYLSAYLSHDRFNLNSDTVYQYTNRNASLKWKHVFNNKLFGLLTASSDHYDYSNSSSFNKFNAYKLNYAIDQQSLKSDFTWYLNTKNTLDFGLGSILYKLHPDALYPSGRASLVIPQVLEKEQGLESALYASDKIDLSSRFSLNLGIRYTMFNDLGPHTVNMYGEGLPLETGNKADSLYYGKGKLIKTYKGPEFRFSARYLISDEFSMKASYNTLHQYVHLMSNSTSIAPTDSWKLSDPNIKPQNGDQFSLGFYENLKSNTIEISAETYYKRIHNYLDYKSGAELVLNGHIETDVFKTRGKAYGVELMIKKTTGKFNGWLSYTWSRTLLKQDDPQAGELINGGRFYPANYDKPNDLNLIGNYKFSHRFSISLNTLYSTGRPITVPVGKFIYAGSERPLYGDRNTYRIPDYFRMDLSMNIEGNHKIYQRIHDSWTLGIYNLTSRKNPYSTYFISQGGLINGYKLSVFGTAIPFINYNLRF